MAEMIYPLLNTFFLKVPLTYSEHTHTHTHTAENVSEDRVML